MVPLAGLPSSVLRPFRVVGAELEVRTSDTWSRIVICTFRSEIIIRALIDNLLSRRNQDVDEASATIPRALGAFCDYAAARRDKMRRS
jgi:hypothetical protein